MVTAGVASVACGTVAMGALTIGNNAIAGRDLLDGVATNMAFAAAFTAVLVAAPVLAVAARSTISSARAGTAAISVADDVATNSGRVATNFKTAANPRGPVSETPVVIRPSGSTGDGIFTPGPHAGQSIPARGPQRSFNTAERSTINDIGATTGCHRCGTTVSGRPSGNFTPDHQPPVSMNPSAAPMQLYPHCASCSAQQGGFVSS